MMLNYKFHPISVPVEMYDAKTAEHTAFMYSLVQSCKLNRIDFGNYIEYVLRQIMDGNKDYRSLLPNHVKLSERNCKPEPHNHPKPQKQAKHHFSRL